MLRILLWYPYKGVLSRNVREKSTSVRDMRCPKCNHQQNNTVECDICGVIFAKYQKILDRKKEEEAQKTLPEEKAGRGAEKTGLGLKLLQVFLLVVVVAATTYYFTGYKSMSSSVQPPKEATPVATKVQTTSVAEPPAAPAQVRITNIPEPQQAFPQPAVAKDNIIERARNATVSIETPLGTGSGFFVNTQNIVTNRHVVQFDEKKIAELRSRVEKQRQFFNLEEQRINEWKQKYQQVPKGPARSQLAMVIDHHEEEQRKVWPMLQEEERKLAKLDRRTQSSEIKIFFADGKELTVNRFIVSPTLDLALLSLYTAERTFLEKPPAGVGLRQGDKIYVVGSPKGLRHSVTAGIFSGLRTLEKDGPVYLQTDAAMNPGNSGGPIIDENGYVRGVATRGMQNAEGLGFAIPIEKVFEEFHSILH